MLCTLVALGLSKFRPFVFPWMHTVKLDLVVRSNGAMSQAKSLKDKDVNFDLVVRSIALEPCQRLDATTLRTQTAVC